MKKLLTLSILVLCIQVQAQDSDLAPLRILIHKNDTFQLKDNLLDRINPDLISTINIFKGKAAKDSFGNNTKNGVVLMKLEENEETDRLLVEIKDSLSKYNGSLNLNGERFNLRRDLNNNRQGIDPLYIVEFNGQQKEIKLDLAELNAEYIQSINVYKGQTSLFNYGKKGKDGVVLILLKSNEEARSLFADLE